MIVLSVIIVLISIFEIMDLKHKGQKKDIVVYAGMAFITFILGLFYLSDPNRTSFVKMIMKVIRFQL